MFEEKFLIFGMFLAIWTISNCHGVAQDPNGAFLVHKILSQNENQNGINQNHLNEETQWVRTYTGKTEACPACTVNKEKYINYTKEAIKKDILKKLGMKNAPSVQKQMAPTHLIHQMMENFVTHSYEHENIQSDDPGINEVDDDDTHFQTKILNILGQDGAGIVPVAITDDGHEIQYFDLNVKQLQDLRWPNVKGAKMFLHLPKAPTPKDLKAWIEIRQVVMGSNGVATFKKKRIVHADLLPDKAGWVEIKMKDIAHEWFHKPENNIGLEIVVGTENGVSLPVGIQHQGSNDRNIPYLQLEIQDIWNMRKRRTLSRTCNKNKEGEKEHCCMEDLKVDFIRDYQWDFVIYPQAFSPNYCVGDCKLGTVMPESPYSHVLQQYGISPCCNAQKMGTLELLYMDEANNIVQGTLPKMIVQRCGCA